MAGTEQNCEPTTDSSVYPIDDDVLVDIFRHNRCVLPRGDVGDATGRNTDQDGDLPVRIVLPSSRTGHSQADREAAQDQGMPNHGSLSANDFGVSGSFLAAGRLKPLPFRGGAALSKPAQPLSNPDTISRRAPNSDIG